MSEQLTQYQRDFIRMLDSMREAHKGEATCVGVEAEECENKCPLTNFCENDICFSAEKIIEIVTQWAKDHPVKTNADVFKGAWGFEPKHYNGEYYCPKPFFGESNCYGRPDDDTICEGCRKAFWEAQYKEPKAERKQS